MPKEPVRGTPSERPSSRGAAPPSRLVRCVPFTSPLLLASWRGGGAQGSTMTCLTITCSPGAEPTPPASLSDTHSPRAGAAGSGASPRPAGSTLNL